MMSIRALRPSSTSISRAPPLPSSCSDIAERNGVALPERLLNEHGRFHYADFLDFLRTYDLAASVIRTAEDYRDITYEYLCVCARGGAVYVELTASPDHATLVGLSDEDHLEGIARESTTPASATASRGGS